MGVNPDAYTLRELDWMAKGRCKLGWLLHSQHLALHANMNRDPKKQPKPFYAHDFNPMLSADERRAMLPKLPFSALKGLVNGSINQRDQSR